MKLMFGLTANFPKPTKRGMHSVRRTYVFAIAKILPMFFIKPQVMSEILIINDTYNLRGKIQRYFNIYSEAQPPWKTAINLVIF